jgi:hypothetical protein
MTAKLACYADGRWVIELMPEGDFETATLLYASAHVWKVMPMGAMLIVAPTKEIVDL